MRSIAFEARLARHDGYFCQCAWCGGYETRGGAYVQLPGLTLPSGLTSHTVCPACEPGVFAEIRLARRVTSRASA